MSASNRYEYKYKSCAIGPVRCACGRAADAVVVARLFASLLLLALGCRYRRHRRRHRGHRRPPTRLTQQQQQHQRHQSAESSDVLERGNACGACSQLEPIQISREPLRARRSAVFHCARQAARARVAHKACVHRTKTQTHKPPSQSRTHTHETHPVT